MITDFQLGMDFGVGYDDLSGAIRGKAVTLGQPTTVPGAEGQEVTFKLDRIETLEELRQAIGISVDAKAKFGLFGGSAKFDFAESSEFKSYALFLLVSVVVRNAFRQVIDTQLNAAAVKLLEDGNINRFREQFGDTFIRGILTGGEYFALLEINTRDATEQKEIAAEIEASKLGTFSVKGQFEQSLASVASKKSVKIRSLQRGGEDTSVPTTGDEIIDRAVNFAASVAGNRSVPFAALTLDYKALDLPAGPTLVDIQFAREVLQDLGALRSMLRTTINDINFVLLNPDQFDLTSDKETELNQTRNRLAQALNDVVQAASRCASSVSSCQQIEDLDLSGLADLEVSFRDRIEAPVVSDPPRSGGGGTFRPPDLDNAVPVGRATLTGVALLAAAKQRKPDTKRSLAQLQAIQFGL